MSNPPYWRRTGTAQKLIDMMMVSCTRRNSFGENQEVYGSQLMYLLNSDKLSAMRLRHEWVYVDSTHMVKRVHREKVYSK